MGITLISPHKRDTTDKIVIMTSPGSIAQLSNQYPEPASAAVTVAATFENLKVSKTMCRAN